MTNLRKLGDTLLRLVGMAPYRSGENMPDPRAIEAASLAAQRTKAARPRTEVESDVIYARRAMLNGSTDLMKAARIRRQYADAVREREEAREVVSEKRGARPASGV